MQHNLAHSSSGGLAGGSSSNFLLPPGLQGGCASPLATLRTAEALGSPTAAGCGGSRTPVSGAKGARQLVYHGRLYGSEVVGRKCCVQQLRDGQRLFEKATVIDFEASSGRHKVRHSASKAEEWVTLANIKFYWRESAPPEAPPNPTFKQGYCGEAAVGKRLRVYWPAMQKWYCGNVKAYDPLTGQHIIYYKVGG